MKYFTLLFVIGLAVSADIVADDDVEVDPVDLEESDYDERRDYTHDLSHLCPNAPDKHALECKKNFKVVHYIKQMIVK